MLQLFLPSSYKQDSVIPLDSEHMFVLVYLVAYAAQNHVVTNQAHANYALQLEHFKEQVLGLEFTLMCKLLLSKARILYEVLLRYVRR